jgi:hypothetical protein
MIAPRRNLGGLSLYDATQVVKFVEVGGWMNLRGRSGTPQVRTGVDADPLQQVPGFVVRIAGLSAK